MRSQRHKAEIHGRIGSIPNQALTDAVAMTALDTSAYFANEALSFGVLGTLPTGLSIAAATGIISGTPSGTGTTDVDVYADYDGGRAFAPLRIVVS